MGRSPCCDKVGLKKGPWTPEEDKKLLAYIDEHGHGSWRALPAKAALQRCGKSCRLRWTNYLRPDIKRGKFSLQEEQTIIQLHALLGNRWSGIATHLPKRTDNEIKNYWNTHLKKRLTKMGIDPVTHKPKNDVVFSADGQSKNAANLSHMAQWESARLEAEARLVKESKLRSRPINEFPHPSTLSARLPTKPPPPSFPPPTSLDVLKTWPSGNIDLESPTSTITFSETAPPPIMSAGAMFEFVGSSNSSETAGVIKEEDDEQEWKNIKNSISFTSNFHEISMSIENSWNQDSIRANNVEDGFTNLLLNDSDELSLSNGGGAGDSDNGGDGDSEYYEDNKNYWNSILNLVNSSPSDDSPMF